MVNYRKFARRSQRGGGRKGQDGMKEKWTRTSGSDSLPWQVLILAAGDYLAIVTAEWGALTLRNALMDYSVFRIAPVYMYLIVPLIFMLFLFIQKLYTKKFTFYQVIEKIFFSCVYSVLLSIVLMFIGQVAGSVSRLYVAVFAVFVFIMISGVRYGLKQLLSHLSLMQTPVLIVGAGLTADVLIREFHRDNGLNYRVVGFLEDRSPRTKYARRYPVLGGFADLERVVAENRVSRVIIAAPGLSQKMQADLLYRAQAVCRDVGIVPNLVEVPMADITVESFYDARVMILHIQNNLSKWSNRAVKRLFDIVAVLLGSLLILPALLGIALWIRLDSPGPVIYRHRRIGKDGRVFHCYKFRSMCVDSEERLQQLLAADEDARREWETTFKLKHDPRITRVGAILRKTSLDELPQLINVLRGEMSLVGPRPIVEKEVPYYGAFIREYYMVRPGITGMWQVSGRSDVDYPERVRMDSWYVHNWSIWLDLLLLWRTIGVVRRGKGAY